MFIFSKFSGPWACRLRADPFLACGYGPGRAWASDMQAGPGLGQTLTVWVAPGPKFSFAGLGRAGLDKMLRAIGIAE